MRTSRMMFSCAAALGLVLIGASSTPGCAGESKPSEGEEVAHATQAWSASCSGGVCTSASVNLTVAQGLPTGGTAGAITTGVVDTQLNQGSPSTPLSPNVASMATGLNSNGDLRDALVQFPLSALPSGAALAALNASAVTVEDAYMSLTLGGISPSGPGTVDVHQVTSPWSRASATWNDPPTWSTGVVTTFDIASGAEGGTTLNNVWGTGLLTLVQGWMASPATNFGVLLEEPGTASANFFDSEWKDPWQRPELTVVYTLTCSAGYADCNGDGGDGCEVDLETDPNNCGACGTACPTPANGAPTCNGGVCGIACNAGSSDCGGTCVNLVTDANNCGTCGNACPAGVSCVDGACGGSVLIAAGNAHGLVARNGMLKASGYNGNGQLGNGTTISNTPVPVTMPSGAAVTVIAAGTDSSYAVAGGKLYAWGDNEYCELGLGASACSSPSGFVNPSPLQVNVPTAADITTISASLDYSSHGVHVLALDAGGSLYAWGANDFGEVGIGTLGGGGLLMEGVPAPSYVRGGLTAIAAGYSFSLAVDTSGQVFSWGTNIDGELGFTTSATLDCCPGFGEGCVCTPTLVPIPGGPPEGAIAVAGGAGHSLALMSDHTLFAWGWNVAGQLGNGTTTDSTMPAHVMLSPSSPLTGVVAIAASEFASYAVRDDGTVWAWGYDGTGLLGFSCTTCTGGNTGQVWPTQVMGLGPGIASSVAAGGGGGGVEFALAVAAQAGMPPAVWGWGYNLAGELGTGSSGLSRQAVLTEF